MGSVPIVDDIAGNIRLMESMLAPDGHAVRTAGDGAEALRLIRAEPPDLVLMDVMEAATRTDSAMPRSPCSRRSWASSTSSMH